MWFNLIEYNRISMPYKQDSWIHVACLVQIKTDFVFIRLDKNGTIESCNSAQDGVGS